MKIGDFIKSKLSRFGFHMEDAELEIHLLDADIVATSGSVLDLEYSKELSVPLKKVLIGLIPELLLRPDISQGDYSEKYKVDGIKSYYSMLCAEVGFPDIYNPTTDRVIDRSDLW